MTRHSFAVTGAQGTGKTTVAKMLHQRSVDEFGDVILLDGIGQRVGARGYPLGAGATPDTLCAFAAEHLKRERLSTAKITIQDRCLLDLLAYAENLKHRALVFMAPGDRRPSAELPSPVLIEMLREVALATLPRLAAIFYVPISNDLRESKSQVEDSQFREEIDQKIRSIASDIGIHLEYLRGSREERLETAFTIVRRILDQNREDG